ncbi:MAG: hypothetical protein N3F66_03680 [Spirochaetes bacterium]|nr:hypothetical protein [Spirochaetota bacterium]
MKSSKNIIFTFINSIAIIILPLLIVFSVIYVLITSPFLYSTILKRTDIVTVFIQAKNFEITQSIQKEIDNQVGLASYVLTYQAIKNQYEEAKKAYDIINKTSEYESLTKQYDEVKKIAYQDVKGIYKDEDTFKKNKEAELQKIKNQIELIKLYRDEHKSDIEAAENKLEELEEKFEDAQEEYNDKQQEANDIIQKHRNTFAAQLNDDLDIIKPILTKIINEKLIDENIIPLIEKYITFFTSYDSIKSRYILELIDSADPLHPKKVTQILLPDITISLWTQENGIKKHILSDILVQEIKKAPGIKNRIFLTTALSLADTTIGELFGQGYLTKVGVWIDNGVIYKHNIVLSGSTAETAITIIKILSYAKYLVYITIALLIVYVFYMAFSPAEKITKRIWLTRILVYPSIILVIIALLGIVLPLYAINPSESLSHISAYIIRAIAFNTALCILLPVIAIFTVLGVSGLIIKKLYLYKT